MRVTVFAVLLLAIAGGIGGWWLTHQTPPPPACQKETVCFDKRSVDAATMERIISLLEQGNVHYDCSITPSRYMESVISHHVTVDMLTTASQKSLGNGNNPDSPLKIRCELIENDKLDPGKKSKNCKLFAGYLLYTFFLDKTQAYKIQIDVMDSKGGDIPERLSCIQESLFYQADLL